ncbi:MAG: hypothetical protein JSW54_12920 [Fidelibacterota bacterium]|nr:MAG: hypothetical protein JSW54_12920 [Candidatus Neomarinimicrobiota bacterium]
MNLPESNHSLVLDSPEKSPIGIAGGNHNPIVWVILILAGLLAVSFAGHLLQLTYVASAYLAICMLLGLRLAPVARSVKMILPWTLVFFAIHLVFSTLAEPQHSPLTVLRRESIILFRLIGLAGVMGVLRQGMSAQSLVDSLKTMADRLHIRSHLVEDFLQTLRLILIFIPQVLREYRNLERFNLALGFTPPGSLRAKVGFYGGNLLPVMSRSLSRARQLGEVMDLRGYGKVIPRGQLTPLPFRIRDGGIALSIILLLGSAGWVS